IQLITFLCRKQKNTIESWINNYSCGNQDKQNFLKDSCIEKTCINFTRNNFPLEDTLNAEFFQWY
ncbi:hypothetical protein, partial [Tangfeifania diversioriginum]|uniref:hypothetical protein n=1 Tax=Tangfeifania diversioriginum TaxID=1168035 RepID=UPI001C31BE51